MLNGRKGWVTGGAALDYLIVHAAAIEDGTDPQVGFLTLPTDLAGISWVHTWDHLGLRASNTHDVVFDNVELPFGAFSPVERPVSFRHRARGPTKDHHRRRAHQRPRCDGAEADSGPPDGLGPRHRHLAGDHHPRSGGGRRPRRPCGSHATGRIVEQGDPRTILVSPRQDYTKRLIAAAPGLANGGRLVARHQVDRRNLPEPVLTLTGVSKTFRVAAPTGGHHDFEALSGVSIEVPRGQTHALVGESGSGKTTALRIALGLQHPTSGSVAFSGTEISDLSWRKQRPLRRQVQIVHQNPFAALDPKFTIKQSIIEPLVSFKVGDRATRTERAKALLEQVALPAAYLDRQRWKG